MSSRSSPPPRLSTFLAADSETEDAPSNFRLRELRDPHQIAITLGSVMPHLYLALSLSLSLLTEIKRDGYCRALAASRAT